MVYILGDGESGCDRDCVEFGADCGGRDSGVGEFEGVAID